MKLPRESKRYRGVDISWIIWGCIFLMYFFLYLGYDAQSQYSVDGDVWYHCQEYDGNETGYTWLCQSGVYFRFAGYYVDVDIPPNGLNLIIQVDDSGIYYCHAPYPTTDLWSTVSIYGNDTGEWYYDVSSVCVPNQVASWVIGGSYNDPYVLTVMLPPGSYRVYFFCTTSSSSPVCGETCLSLGVESLLGLSVGESHRITLKPNQSMYDILGRRLKN